jgi:hypothetical protein
MTRTGIIILALLAATATGATGAQLTEEQMKSIRDAIQTPLPPICENCTIATGTVDKQWCLDNGMIWSADNVCLMIPPTTIFSSGSTVTGSTSYVEPKTSHLIEYTGKMFRHDGMTATECDKLRVEIESKTSEHAECVQ